VNREAAAPAAASSITTLFSDIEGSTRLWEQRPDEMRAALAAPDAIARDCVVQHHGTLIKTTGDGIHAVFGDAADAIATMVALLHRLADPAATAGLPLKVRLGAHCGADELRGGDYYGRDVNRAARIMSVAHGGQMLVSQAVVDRLGGAAPPAAGSDAAPARGPAGVSLRDLGLVRLRDLAEPQRLYQVVHPGLRADFPALRSLEATPNNLPQQLNRFIGRERESAELMALLRSNRLVTLLGLGGLGKSRLSVQLAAELLDEHPDGVWFVELAPVADARLVPHAVAGVLGVQEEPGVPLVEALVRTLRERRLLIVLDNCEHVVDACAELAKRLLQGAASLTLLATSREALRVAGEACYQLPALSAPALRPASDRALAAAGAGLPAPHGPDEVEALLTHEAVRLFVDRAQAARRDFRLAEANAGAVAEICAQLDGIPLALELAAARVRALSVEAIAERIADRFRLLKTTDQTVLPRQRTLRALIDWSHDLLSEPEQALFARLAVFAGGWTLEAAEAVAPSGAADDPVAPDEVLDLLAGLVEKSLVALDAEGGRYRFLETVRAYAQERLDAEPSVSASVRGRHLVQFLALAEAGFAGSRGADAPRWLARLDDERENLLAAVRFAIDQEPGAEPALRLVHALGMYWSSKGLLSLSRLLGKQALSRPGAEQAGVHWVAGLVNLGQDLYYGGDPRAARVELERALARAEALGDEGWIMRAAYPLGIACKSLDDLPTAEAQLLHAQALASRLGDIQMSAAAADALGHLYRLQSDFAQAAAQQTKALQLARDSGRRDAIVIALINLATAHLLDSETATAAPLVDEAARAAHDLDSVPLAMYVADVATGLAAGLSDWLAVARWHATANALAQQGSLTREPFDEAFVQRAVTGARNVLGDFGFDAAGAIDPHPSATGAMQAVARWLESTSGRDGR
jgi:predicted ATPase/class 3 adenylate cyclase